MNKEIVVYKISNVRDDNLYHSFAAYDTDVVYEIGKTYSNIEKPYFAFKTLNDAKHTLSLNTIFPNIILKCNAIKSTYQPRFCSYLKTKKNIDLFWEYVRNKKRNIHKLIYCKILSNEFPGTIFCESITPIEIIA